MRPVRTDSGRHPFEVTSLLAALVCGITLVGIEGSPRSVSAAIPGDLERAWELTLVVVGVVGLVGILWPGHPATRLGVELGALLALGAVTGMYAIALLVSIGASGVFAGTFTAGTAVAAWCRAIQIVRDLGRLARLDDTAAPVDVPMLVERDPP
ncbi:hypothetical protein [Plantactinospora sonchi]|uniref:Uncharacterized protein n=1 Tax=Plantactinospora sonchi TaxID=1544735 RepID=A0ABU7RZD8_9ACTN